MVGSIMSKELLEAIESKDPVRISEAFEQAMKPKCVSKIHEIKESMINKIVSEEEE